MNTLTQAAARYMASPSVPVAVPPALAAPAKAPAGAIVREAIAESQDTWSHEISKLATLGTAAAGAFLLPVAVATAVPALAGFAFSAAGPLTALALTSIEESQIGIGKHVGSLLGTVVGSAVGAGTGLARVALGHDNLEPARYDLPERAPTGRRAHEALLPTAMHAVERKITGHDVQRTHAVELGENIGAFVASSAAGLAVPFLAAGTIGGPVGIIMSSLIGSVLGIIAGGAEESLIGVGRFAGEMAGQAYDGVRKLMGKPPTAPAGVIASQPHAKGAIGKGAAWVGHKILEGLEVLSEPLVTFMLDASGVTNHLFGEKAWQTTGFQQRTMPNIDRQRVLDTFTELAGIPGTWHHEQEIGKAICDRLDAMGIPWTKNADGSVIGTLAGTVADAPTVLLSSHQDTVKPTAASALRQNERKFYTDGRHVLGGDDRAGCTEILEGVRYVLENKLDHPEVKLVFTTGEEAGLRGADNLKTSDISNRPTLGFVVDSTDIHNIFLTNDSVIITPDSVKYNFSQEDPLIQVTMRSMADAGTPLRVIHAPIMTGAGSDANTPAFNSGPIRSLAVGAGESDIHTGFENIKKDGLVQGAKHVVGYVTNACDLKVDGDKIVARYAVK